MQKELSAVIEKDAALNAEITQLQDSECDCENANINQWNFPVVCLVLYSIYFVIYVLYFMFVMSGVCSGYIAWFVLVGLSMSIVYIAVYIFHCSWYNPPPWLGEEK
jgi:hypothetical protein